ncbi:hypothetical protein S245_060849 [Arachis hypogaea]
MPCIETDAGASTTVAGRRSPSRVVLFSASRLEFRHLLFAASLEGSVSTAEWTDEKHSMFLNSMEASFVHQLYDFKQTFASITRLNESHDLKTNPWIQHYGSSHKLGAPHAPIVHAEMSDQNFADEEAEEQQKENNKRDLTSVHRHHRTLAAVAAPLAGSFDSCSRVSPLSSVCARLLRLPPPVSARAVRVCCCSSSVVVSARLSRTDGVSSFVFLVFGVSRPFLGASSPAAEATRGAVASFVAFRGVVAVDRDRW